MSVPDRAEACIVWVLASCEEETQASEQSEIHLDIKKLFFKIWNKIIHNVLILSEKHSPGWDAMRSLNSFSVGLGF